MSQATIDRVRRELDVSADAPLTAPTLGYWKSVAQRLSRDPVTIAVTLVLLGIIFISLVAPLVAGADPYAGNVLARLKPIGTPGHWLGTDETGRDLVIAREYLTHGLRERASELVSEIPSSPDAWFAIS